MASRSGHRRRRSTPGGGQPRRSPVAGRPGLSASRQRQRAPSSSAAQWLSSPNIRHVRDQTGLPALALVLGLAFWIVALLLWATGAVKGSFAVFLGTALSAAVGTGYLAAAAAKAKQPLLGARTVLLLVLIAIVPVVFDPHTGDVFNVPKYAVVVIGALVLAGLWAVASVHNRAAPTWRNGFQWVVAALVAWTAVSALTGMDVHVGLLGNYGSYDGLFSAACFGVMAMTAAEALDGDGVRRALGTFAFCGGAVVVVYGLIQLHDVEISGPKWDFITWQRGSFAQDFFSTFGNPNHLGGYLAMLLPAVLVLGLGTKHWAWRVASGLLAVAVLTELIKASARGAWLGAIAALVVLAVVLAPELRRRALLTASAAAGVVAIAAAGMALDGKRFLAEPLSALFQSGGNTSVEQRLEIWKAAFRIALDHPITGIGARQLRPDLPPVPERLLGRRARAHLPRQRGTRHLHELSGRPGLRGPCPLLSAPRVHRFAGGRYVATPARGRARRKQRP